MGDSVEPHVCEVCYHNYNEKSRVPKVLTCGHTYCARCVREMFNHGASILTCPVCRVVTRSRLARDLEVVKEQKLLCTEVDEEVAVSNDNQEPMVNEEVDDGIFAMAKHFESEVNTLKAITTSLGLNFSHCFPNSKFISGTLPDSEDSNTLSAIINGVNSIQKTYSGVCFLLRKAKHQNELVAEQMQAGTAKKLPNGGVELKHERPNGNPVDDHDLLYPPAPGALFDIPDDDDNSWNDDGESYSADSQLISYGGADLADDLDNLMWLNTPFNPAVIDTDWGAHNDDEESNSYSSTHRRCDICECDVPYGAHHARVHDNGRRHQHNLLRRAQGLAPENPFQIRRPIGGRGGRGGVRGGRGRGGRGRGYWNQQPSGAVGGASVSYGGGIDHDLFMGAPSNSTGALYGGYNADFW